MTMDATAPAKVFAVAEQLRQENQIFRALIAGLEQRITDVAAQNRALRDQLDQAQRQAARPAAPF